MCSNNVTTGHPDSTLGLKETRQVRVLRLLLFLVIVVLAVLAEVGVYLFTKNLEQQRFETEYEANAARLIDNFEQLVEKKLVGINSLSTAYTSFALATQQTFPFVTLPHFAVRGSDMRVLSNALIIHYMPLVTDSNREEWEEYALANRFQIDNAFDEEVIFREEQDEYFGLNQPNGDGRMLQNTNANLTMLDDGTKYHPKIWNNGSVKKPEGDAPSDSGPYLPLWQRSPVSSAKQWLLNINWVNTKVFEGALQVMMETGEAVINPAAAVLPQFAAQLEENLSLGQYRYNNIQQKVEDPVSFLSYPVFDSFHAGKKLAGVISANIYWSVFFADILQPSAAGYICVLENSFDQVLSYRVDGSNVAFLGQEDYHDPEYNYLVERSNINEFVQRRSKPETRSFTTVSLSNKFGEYTLKIYPSADTQELYLTPYPVFYTSVVVAASLVTACLFWAFTFVVEKRQRLVMRNAIVAAEKRAQTERSMNEFLSHEVRNPLAAAMTALSNADADVKESALIVGSTFQSNLVEDFDTMKAGLYFIDEFLRSILDVYKAAEKKLEIQLSPVDLENDVIQPVCSILKQRNNHISILADCPSNLLVMTDALRLKQILLNLGRNSTKFMTEGSICFRAKVVHGLVELSVEDDGIGIPPDKQAHLFDKFQASLDYVGQGTGLGLSLSKYLTDLLGGNIFLDTNYKSKKLNVLGARFVIELKMPAIASDTILNCSESCTDTAFSEAATSNSDDDLPEELSVLFVDDDMILRKLFVRAVRKLAPMWIIREAASGEAALEMVKNDDFDIIFLDNYMSATGKTLLGTETARELRNRGIRSALCGLSANDLATAFLENGADSFVMKPLPCEPKALKHMLLGLLQHSRTRQLGEKAKTSVAI